MKLLSNTPPPKNSEELAKHFSATYFSLRRGLFLLAFAMPVVLFFYGKFMHELDLQPSMSAYFWAASTKHCASFPMRTIFVGFLFAIGAGLYFYKGLTPLENTLLNVAAICAAVVAIFPERISVKEAETSERVDALFKACPAIKAWATAPSLPIHYGAAILLFLLLALVAWFCAKKSLEYLPVGYDPGKFILAYKVIAFFMVLFPVVGLVLAFFFGAASSKIFFIEAAGVVTFGVYWTVKSRELALSRLEKDPKFAVQNAAGPGQP